MGDLISAEAADVRPIPPIVASERPGRARGAGRLTRRVLGLRQSFTVGGVRYREVTTEPLRSALSRKGSGAKEYDATFGDGATMRIRCTAERVYPDVGAPPTGWFRWAARACERAGPLVRPGSRVLVIPGGTGAIGAWLGGRAGPSGAVVALDPDAESIRYAQKRYGAPNVAFECAGISALAGETDGSFGAVLALGATALSPTEAGVPRSLWRLVGPGGWMLIGAPRPANASPDAFPNPETMVGEVRGLEDPAHDPDKAELLVGVISRAEDEWVGVVVARPPGADR